MAATELKTRLVNVTPTPGFVVKTTTTQPGFYTAPSPSQPQQNIRHAVPLGLKVFINVAYSQSVPPPPTSALPTEEENEIIKRAIDGDVESAYFVPVVVGHGRPDKDKAGKPCLVFDAFLNNILKSRMTKDLNYKSLVLEIILSYIESPPLQAESRSLSLSRTLAMPNIRFKGTLEPRQLEILDLPELQDPNGPKTGAKPSKLIEVLPEVPEPSTKPLKSILKKPNQSGLEPAVPSHDPHAMTDADARLDCPNWEWRDTRTLIVNVPKLFKDHHPQCTLLASEDILTLRTPSYFLQVPFNQDNELNVERVQAQWRTEDGKIVITI